MEPSTIDGSLLTWDEVAEAEEWQALLLGNGLSINVWPHFVYDSLFDQAQGAGLTDVDRRLFRGTTNFERVLADFLHGALHLVVGGAGVTWKLRRNAIQSLLEQFGQPLQEDPQARALLVTEGSSQEKLRAIENNDYLAHALDQLRDCDLPLVVFGSSLSEQDQHLTDALNEHPTRPIAVSMHPGRKRELAAQQADIYGRLEAETLIFFDSTTHPLGSTRLAVTVPDPSDVRDSAYP